MWLKKKIGELRLSMTIYSQFSFILVYFDTNAAGKLIIRKYVQKLPFSFYNASNTKQEALIITCSAI